MTPGNEASMLSGQVVPIRHLGMRQTEEVTTCPVSLSVDTLRLGSSLAMMDRASSRAVRVHMCVRVRVCVSVSVCLFADLSAEHLRLVPQCRRTLE